MDDLIKRARTLDPKSALVAWGSGCVVFPTSIFALQRLLFVPLRASSHQIVFGNVLGLLSVGASSILASEVSRATYTFIHPKKG